MKKFFLFVLLIFFPYSSYPAVKTITCSPPQGMRIDYFSINQGSLQNNTFLMGKDQVSKMNPQIVLNDNNQDVSFIIGDASELKSQPKVGNMKVFLYNQDQISFAGMINGAPIFATYYPKLAILIYSQQSVWTGENYQGARAVMFYSKCANR